MICISPAALFAAFGIRGRPSHGSHSALPQSCSPTHRWCPFAAPTPPSICRVLWRGRSPAHANGVPLGPLHGLAQAKGEHPFRVRRGSRGGRVSRSAIGPQFAPLGGYWRIAVCPGQSIFTRSDPAWPNPANAQCVVPLQRVGPSEGRGRRSLKAALRGECTPAGVGQHHRCHARG